MVLKNTNQDSEDRLGARNAVGTNALKLNIALLIGKFISTSKIECISFFPPGFSTKTLCAFSFSSMRATFLVHRIILDLITQIIFLAESTNYEAHYYALISDLL
jgi:hypothetical protein